MTWAGYALCVEHKSYWRVSCLDAVKSGGREWLSFTIAFRDKQFLSKFTGSFTMLGVTG